MKAVFSNQGLKLTGVQVTLSPGMLMSDLMTFWARGSKIELLADDEILDQIPTQPKVLNYDRPNVITYGISPPLEVPACVAISARFSTPGRSLFDYEAVKVTLDWEPAA